MKSFYECLPLGAKFRLRESVQSHAGFVRGVVYTVNGADSNTVMVNNIGWISFDKIEEIKPVVQFMDGQGIIRTLKERVTEDYLVNIHGLKYPARDCIMLTEREQALFESITGNQQDFLKKLRELYGQ